MADLPNSWTTKEAAEWAGIPHRVLLDFFAEGLLPAVPLGRAHVQHMASGAKRRRRVGRWIVPVQAFIAAWETFSVPRTTPKRRRAA